MYVNPLYNDEFKESILEQQGEVKSIIENTTKKMEDFFKRNENRCF